MKILLLSKFANTDEYLLRFTEKITQKATLQVDLIHVINSYPQIPLNTNGTIIDHCVDYDLTELYQLKQEKLSDASQIKSIFKFIETIDIQIGNLDKIIKNIVQNNHYDYIFMGAHKTNYFEDLTHESTINSIMELVDIPILSLKCDQSHYPEINNIGLIDLFENSTYLPKMSLLINALGARAHLIYISSNHFTEVQHTEKLKQMNDFANQNQLKDFKLHIYDKNNKTNEEIVSDCINENNIQLIAINQFHRHKIKWFQSGSLKRDIANHIQTPLITF